MAIPRSYSDPGPNPREQDDDAAVRVPPLPLSEPARPMRDPPWTPAEERNDPNTRHMAAGVAVALRLLMRNHAALGPIPDAFDEHRSARARVPLPFGNALTPRLLRLLAATISVPSSACRERRPFGGAVLACGTLA